LRECRAEPAAAPDPARISASGSSQLTYAGRAGELDRSDTITYLSRYPVDPRVEELIRQAAEVFIRGRDWVRAFWLPHGTARIHLFLNLTRAAVR
jgi:hypothetical protein